jgi:hypothetical protein
VAGWGCQYDENGDRSGSLSSKNNAGRSAEEDGSGGYVNTILRVKESKQRQRQQRV